MKAQQRGVDRQHHRQRGREDERRLHRRQHRQRGPDGVHARARRRLARRRHPRGRHQPGPGRNRPAGHAAPADGARPSSAMPARYEELFKEMSFGRPATPEEIAWTAVAFLASERSSYTTAASSRSTAEQPTGRARPQVTLLTWYPKRGKCTTTVPARGSLRRTAISLASTAPVRLSPDRIRNPPASPAPDRRAQSRRSRTPRGT